MVALVHILWKINRTEFSNIHFDATILISGVNKHNFSHYNLKIISYIYHHNGYKYHKYAKIIIKTKINKLEKIKNKIK